MIRLSVTSKHHRHDIGSRLDLLKHGEVCVSSSQSPIPIARWRESPAQRVPHHCFPLEG